MSNNTTRAHEIYDLSPKEREVAEWRAQRRLALRNEYLREKHNPNAEGHIFDPAVQRHYSVNFAYERIFKPNVYNFLWSIGLTAGVITLVAWRVKVFRDARENKFRTGQVSYRDRDWKFV